MAPLRSRRTSQLFPCVIRCLDWRSKRLGDRRTTGLCVLRGCTVRHRSAKALPKVSRICLSRLSCCCGCVRYDHSDSSGVHRDRPRVDRPRGPFRRFHLLFAVLNASWRIWDHSVGGCLRSALLESVRPAQSHLTRRCSEPRPSLRSAFCVSSIHPLAVWQVPVAFAVADLVSR